MVSVTVTTASGGTSAPLASAYTYNAPPTVTGVSPSSGPAAGGTSVSVSGTNLTGATAVHFGSTAGTVTAVATPITVTSRRHRDGRRHGDHAQRHLGDQHAE